MALTATATRGMRKDIEKILGMKDPLVVTASPDKANVVFYVRPYVSFEVSFGKNVEELGSARTNLGRTIIYCRSKKIVPIYICFSNSAWATAFENHKMLLICLDSVSWTCL